MIHSVEAPIHKVKEIILQDWPVFYNMCDEGKRRAISYFVKPIHQDYMFEYMKNTEKILERE